MTDPGTDPLAEFVDTDGGLLFWHPVDDAAITEAFLPWGEVAPGSSADVLVRVRNCSGDYTAQAVVVAVGPPAGAGAADASTDHLVSADGDVFTATAGIGDLPPGATSDPVTLRRVTAPDADLGPAGFTLTATAAGWVPAAAGTTDGTDPAPGDDGYDPDGAEVPADDPEDQM